MARAFDFFIIVYQSIISPLLGPCCRFEPSCSCYARQAVRRWGFFMSLGLIARRLLKCRPGGSYGWDPVPERRTGN